MSSFSILILILPFFFLKIKEKKLYIYIWFVIDFIIGYSIGLWIKHHFQKQHHFYYCIYQSQVHNYVFIIIIVGIRNLSKGFGLWAMPEDAKEPDDNNVLIRANRLLGRGRELVTANRWCCLRSQPSSESRMEF